MFDNMPGILSQSEVAVFDLNLINTPQCNSAWECYQAGFAGPPWNEWKLCTQCNAQFGYELGDEKICPQCKGQLKLFWPIGQIESDIITCIKARMSCCKVALHRGKVVGLVLGYAIEPNLLQEELGIHFPSSQPLVAYQDEVVVHPCFQGHGIGRRLYDEWKTWATNNQFSQLVARTLANPPSVVYSWYQRLGYQVIAKYPKDDHRVILSLEV